METTHDEYYTRKLTRDYGENFFPCSGFIACSFSFIVFMITISVYMSFCLAKEDIKREINKEETAHKPENKSDSKEKSHHDSLTTSPKDKPHDNSLSKNKEQAPSPLIIDPKEPYAELSRQLKDPSFIADLYY